mgnify:FL=1
MNITIKDHINQYHKYLEEWKNLWGLYEKEEKQIKHELYLKLDLKEIFKETLIDIEKRTSSGRKIKYQIDIREMNSEFVKFQVDIMVNSIVRENQFSTWEAKYFHYDVEKDEIKQITVDEYYDNEKGKTPKIFGITAF